MLSQEFSIPVFAVKTDRIVFVIAHNRFCIAAASHMPDYSQGFRNFWPSIDKVSGKKRDASGMFPYVLFLGVPHLPKQLFQCICMPVNVSDEVYAVDIL
jgi:hypothetical protein